MPRPKSLKPAYCHHIASGRAYVTLNGNRVYLGVWDTQASRDAYDRRIGEWITSGRLAVEPSVRRDRAGQPAASGMTVLELIDRYWTYAKGYYVNADGTETSEIHVLRMVLRLLKRIYGDEPAAAFGPKQLKALRQHMIDGEPASDDGGGRKAWSRRSINKQTDRIKRMFKWAVSEELVEPAVYQALAAVDGLRQGRSGARETEPVRPVPLAQVEAVLPFLSRQLRAMVQLQLTTGARGGELCVLRTGDLDTSGEVWTYRPVRHKGSHRGLDRIIRFGPKGKDILTPLLKTDVGACIFSPADSEAERRQAMREARTTPIHRGNRIGTNRKAAPRKQPGQHYTKDSYCRAIARACDKAFPPPPELTAPPDDATPERKKETARKLAAWRKAHRFHPHQLRHAAATFIASTEGIEMARIILGHRHLNTTQIYAEADQERAEQIMRKIG